MEDKLLSLLGLARRAGKLALGADAAEEALCGGKAALAVLAADISPRTEEAARRAAARYGVPVCKLRWTMDRLGAAVGKRAGVIAVKDAGFAGAIAALWQTAATEE